MPRKSKIQIQETLPTPVEMDVVEVQLSHEAQYKLDCEFLRFLEQHAIINKCGYEFKSEEDKEAFHKKYEDALNRIRATFNLDEIQLSKSTLEREDKVKKSKRVVKPKKTPAETPDISTFDVPTETNHEKIESISVDPSLEKMVNELAKANRTLMRISAMIESIKATKVSAHA